MGRCGVRARWQLCEWSCQARYKQFSKTVCSTPCHPLYTADAPNGGARVPLESARTQTSKRRRKPDRERQTRLRRRVGAKATQRRFLNVYPVRVQLSTAGLHPSGVAAAAPWNAVDRRSIEPIHSFPHKRTLSALAFIRTRAGGVYDREESARQCLFWRQTSPPAGVLHHAMPNAHTIRFERAGRQSLIAPRVTEGHCIERGAPGNTRPSSRRLTSTHTHTHARARVRRAVKTPAVTALYGLTETP